MCSSRQEGSQGAGDGRGANLIFPHVVRARGVMDL